MTKNNVRISRIMLTIPAPSQACLNKILKGVEKSSLANVWSSGIVALKANKAPTCMIKNRNPCDK